MRYWGPNQRPQCSLSAFRADILGILMYVDPTLLAGDDIPQSVWLGRLICGYSGGGGGVNRGRGWGWMGEGGF